VKPSNDPPCRHRGDGTSARFLPSVCGYSTKYACVHNRRLLTFLALGAGRGSTYVRFFLYVPMPSRVCRHIRQDLRRLASFFGKVEIFPAGAGCILPRLTCQCFGAPPQPRLLPASCERSTVRTSAQARSKPRIPHAFRDLVLGSQTGRRPRRNPRKRSPPYCQECRKNSNRSMGKVPSCHLGEIKGVYRQQRK
jgi:hypothetical protein